MAKGKGGGTKMKIRKAVGFKKGDVVTLRVGRRKTQKMKVTLVSSRRKPHAPDYNRLHS
jgi:hypothetical protein